MCAISPGPDPKPRPQFLLPAPGNAWPCSKQPRWGDPEPVLHWLQGTASGRITFLGSEKMWSGCQLAFAPRSARPLRSYSCRARSRSAVGKDASFSPAVPLVSVPRTVAALSLPPAKHGSMFSSASLRTTHSAPGAAFGEN